MPTCIIHCFRLAYAVYFMQKVQSEQRSIILYDIACTLHGHLEVIHMLYTLCIKSIISTGSALFSLANGLPRVEHI